MPTLDPIRVYSAIKKVKFTDPTSKSMDQNDLKPILDALGIDTSRWFSFLTSEEAQKQAEMAVNWLVEQAQPNIVAHELQARGVKLEDLCQGSWLVIRIGSELHLAVLLREVTPEVYRCWLADETCRNIHARNLWKHLTCYYPAPIATNGKTILPKAKLLYDQIVASLEK